LAQAGFNVDVIGAAIAACHTIARNDTAGEQSRDRVNAARTLLALLPKQELKRGPQKLVVEIQAPDWLKPKAGVPIGGGESQGVIEMQALPAAPPEDAS